MTLPLNPASLKNRILAAVVLVLIVGIWGLATRVSMVLQADIERILSEQLAATAGYVAADIDSNIQLRLDVLKEIAAAISPDMLNSPARLDRHLEQHVETKALFATGVVVADKAGITVAQSESVPGRRGASIADRDYFRAIVAGGSQAVGSPVLGRFTGRPIVPFAVPIKDASGMTAAVLYSSAFLSDQALFAQLEQMRIGRTGQFVVASPRDGLVVSATDKGRILQPTPARGVDPLYDRRAYEGFEGSGIAVSSRGVEVLTSSRNMKTTGWIAIAAVDTAEAFAPIANLKQSIYLMALAMSLALIVVLRFILGRQLAPLDAAGAAMRAMTDGVTPLAPIAVRQHDEVGRLVGNFNRLVDERKRSEAALADSERRFRTIFDGINDAIFIHDIDSGAILDVNRRMCEMYGYSREEALQLTVEDISEGCQPYCLVDAVMWLMKAAAGEPQLFEWHARARDGRLFWVEMGVRCTRLDGEVDRLLVVVRDIGERKLAEMELLKHKELLEERVQLRTAELIAAREEAEAANLAKSTFLANMSHEIRTPLNAIIGMTHLVQNTAPTPAQRDYMDKIRRASEHLLAIIDDILDFSKIEAGKIEIESVPFRLDRVMRSVAEQIGDEAAAKGLVFGFAIDAGLPAHLRGDPLRLTQVLLNLAGNAVKFTERGQVAVRVGKVEESAAAVRVRFAVQDTGIGLSAEQSAKLFRSFQQADTSITRKYGGTGLGLAISKRLVEMMGGAIGVDSERGQGSTFWIELPLGKVAAPPDADAVALPAPACNPAALAGARVLLVEDNPFNQQIAQELLEQVGVTVTLAGNGREALELLCRHGFDCVLMDMQMPVMDGLEATRRIRADTALADVRIVAMTANATQEDRAACLAAGMDDFLAKPFPPGELYAVLATAMPLRHAAPLSAAATPAAGDSRPALPPGDAQVIDLAVLARALGHDAAKIAKFARRFVATARAGLAEVEAALAHADAAALKFLGHRLKSPARTVGAAGFAECCEALERTPESGGLDAARAVAARMQNLLGEIAVFIENACNNDDGPIRK